ncbi:MAG: YdcF family protein [Caldilineaceae bacterium]|nr:YdcF family protein [Caldilineaceae bacterium]
MFLFLSKLLPLFVYPVGLASILLVVALLMYKHRRVQQVCIGLALGLLLAFGNEWVAHRLVSSLEWRYLPQGELPQAQAIVLLGGGTRPHLPPRPMSEMNEAGDRVGYAAKLYHEGKAPFIVVSGGFIEFFGSTVPEADAMQELLMAYGVPQEAIVREDRSRNTHENALYVREIADARSFNQILLVTSGLHMPRSVAIFEHQGFEVLPAPADFLATWDVEGRTSDLGVDGWVLKIIPNSERLDYSTRSLREYIGMVVYRLRGWL